MTCTHRFRPAGATAPAPLRDLQQGDQVAGFFVEQVKDWGDNVSVKLSGGQLSDGGVGSSSTGMR